MPRKRPEITAAEPERKTSLTVNVSTLIDVQELKTLLSRERNELVNLDEAVRVAMREAIDRRREQK
jgi:hypothetical protein